MDGPVLRPGDPVLVLAYDEAVFAWAQPSPPDVPSIPDGAFAVVRTGNYLELVAAGRLRLPDGTRPVLPPPPRRAADTELAGLPAAGGPVPVASARRPATARDAAHQSDTALSALDRYVPGVPPLTDAQKRAVGRWLHRLADDAEYGTPPPA